LNEFGVLANAPRERLTGSQLDAERVPLYQVVLTFLLFTPSLGSGRRTLGKRFGACVFLASQLIPPREVVATPHNDDLLRCGEIERPRRGAFWLLSARSASHGLSIGLLPPGFDRDAKEHVVSAA